MTGNFNCDLCGRGYANKNILLQHFSRGSCKNMTAKLVKEKKRVEMLLKRKKRLFSCQLCPNTHFAYGASLRKHQHRHHTPSNTQSLARPSQLPLLPPSSPPGTDYKVPHCLSEFKLERLICHILIETILQMPVFFPTMEQFKNIIKYVEEEIIAKSLHTFGAAKVIQKFSTYEFISHLF